MRKYFPLTKALNANETMKSLWERAKSEGCDALELHVETILTKASDTENTFHAIFSSDREDRHWDVVEQNFDLKAFKKNPVFLDSHNYDTIAAIIGKVVKIGVTDGKLQGDIEFALSNPRGRLAYELAEGGYLNTTSIGFIPKEFSDKGSILKSELLEISAVSVPANADATFEREAPAPETKQETVPDPEPVVTPSHRPAQAHARALSAVVAARKQTLAQLARDVQEMTEANRLEKKRSIHKAIRYLLRADT